MEDIMRKAEEKRKTKETEVEIALNLDGTGKADIVTNCGFIQHMLELFARHGRFDLVVRAKGDVEVDFHHLVEDIGIVLGRVFDKALGDRRGIKRYGSFILPMDESLVLCAVDICGRASVGYGLEIPAEKIGDFDTELVREFLFGLARNMGASIHAKQLAGGDSHHIIEATFKGLARALKEAVSIDEDYKDEIPSTKGTIL